MKKTIRLIILLAMVLTVASFVAWDRYLSPEAKRSRLAQKFTTVMPDSLTDLHREEVVELLDLFWYYEDRDKVDPEDAEKVMTKLEGYVDAGRVTPSDLVYFMAQVGYYTRRMDPGYNLPEGEVDHPVLNPDAAVYQYPSHPDSQARRIPTPKHKRKQP